MGKRGNENPQTSREDYEASNFQGDDKEEESPTSSGGMFQRASAEQLKGRRIAKVKGGGKWAQPEKNNIATSVSQKNGSKPSSNPFAGFQGLAPAAIITSKPKTSIPSALPPPPAATTISSPSTKSTKDHRSLAYFKAMAKHRPKESWSAGIEAMTREDFSAMKKFASASSNATATLPTPTPTKKSATSSFTFGVKTSNSPKPVTASQQFAFGSTSINSVAPAKPFTGFSFGSSNATPKPAATFAAGAPIKPVTPTVDDDGFPTEERAAVAKEENKDEDVLFEARVKLYKSSDGEMKASDAGVVQLLQLKKSPDKRRLVMRNDVGKVRLNESIPKGMTVKKDIAKGGKTGSVLFRSLGGIFRLKTKIESLDGLHIGIQEAAVA